MTSAKTAAGTLRAGVAKCDITTDKPEVGIRDPLHAKVLVLDDGRTKVALIAMDTVAIGGRRIGRGYLDDVGEEFLPRLRQRVERELGIPGLNVLVNASHTHPPGRLLCDDDEQVRRTFDAVSRAAASMTEATVGAGSGHENRITINRTLRLKDGRDWTIRHCHPCPPDEAVEKMGPIDPEIGIIRIDRLDGRPLAVVYNFASHLGLADTVGSVSANFPAIASALVEETLGDDSMALFLQGAGGNIADVTEKDFTRPRDIEPLGTMLGLSILKAWRGSQTGTVDLNVITETIELPRRSDIPQRVAALRQEQAELLESLRGTALDFKTFLPLYLQHALDPEHPANHVYHYLKAEAIGDEKRTAMDAFSRRHIEKYLASIRAMERLSMIQDDLGTLGKHEAINAQSGEATITAEVQGIRIGDGVLITSPAELLVEIGLNLKAASPYKHTLVVPFSNGYLHYGAPADAYPRGGYEVTECLLGPQWQPIYERKALDILRRL